MSQFFGNAVQKLAQEGRKAEDQLGAPQQLTFIINSNIKKTCTQFQEKNKKKKKI